MAAPRRILIFSLAYYPHVGGAEVAIKELTDRLGDIEFHLITMRFVPGELPQEQLGHVHVHRVGSSASYLAKILFVPRAALYARTLNQQLHFSGLWAMMTYMLFPVVLARALGVRAPYVVTLQDGDPFAHVFSRWFIVPLRPLLRRGFRRAAIVQTISTYLAGWARAMGYTGPVEVVPNGVDTKAFAGAPVAHDGTVLITTSRLVRKNAVDVILRALALLPPEVQLRVLGEGQEERALKALAQELGVAGRVEWLGHIDRTAMPQYLHAADIFVRPSRSEGMGVSFIEAMTAGLPVIATQEGGIADFLFDATRNPGRAPTGYAVDPDSPEQVAAAVERIRANPTEAAQVIANARALVAARYDWDHLARLMRERVFARVL